MRIINKSCSDYCALMREDIPIDNYKIMKDDGINLKIEISFLKDDFQRANNCDFCSLFFGYLESPNTYKGDEFYIQYDNSFYEIIHSIFPGEGIICLKESKYTCQCNCIDCSFLRLIKTPIEFEIYKVVLTSKKESSIKNIGDINAISRDIKINQII